MAMAPLVTAISTARASGFGPTNPSIGCRPTRAGQPQVDAVTACRKPLYFG